MHISPNQIASERLISKTDKQFYEIQHSGLTILNHITERGDIAFLKVQQAPTQY